MPTIVSPDLYYERFIIQMQQFILAVPDRWFGLESGPDKWTCGVQGQGWSAYTAGGGGGRSEKVQNLDPYPSFLNYWDPVVSSRSNTEENWLTSPDLTWPDLTLRIRPLVRFCFSPQPKIFWKNCKKILE